MVIRAVGSRVAQAVRGRAGWAPSRRAAAVGTALLAGSLFASPLSSQVVQGRVVDAVSGEPVAAASVELLAGQEEVQVHVSSGDDGRFMLRARSPGTFRIRSGRIGFQTVTTPPFDLVRDEEPLEVEVLLGVEAIPLAPLVVVSDRPAQVEHLRLHIRGFHERRNTWGEKGMGFGQFLGPEELEAKILFQASDALRDLRGVRVGGAGGRRQQILFRDGRCPPRLYVDGVWVRDGDLNGVVSPSEILAMEIYLGMTGPPEFVDECGAIVVWTGGRR
jgi:hypothetical protein